MLDTKLFNALRAGGLGHKAAALLADSSSRYSLGGDDLYDTENELQSLRLALDSETLQAEYGKYTDSSVNTASLLVPVRAGSVLSLRHNAYSPAGGTVTPDGSYFLGMVKVADANGIPVAPARAQGNADRSSGALSGLSATDGGWTFGASGPAFTATQATAGHYIVFATFSNDVRR